MKQISFASLDPVISLHSPRPQSPYESPTHALRQLNQSVDLAPDDFARLSSGRPLIPFRATLPKNKKKLNISLFVLFILPIVVIAAAFFTVTWVVFRQSAVKSVDNVSEQLHHLAILHAQDVIDSMLEKMDSLVRFIASETTVQTTPDETKDLFCKLMNAFPEIPFLLFGRLDYGYAIVAKRVTPDTFALGERPAEDLAVVNTSFPNLVYRLANTSGYVSTEVQGTTMSYDTVHRPWFTAAATTLELTFTKPYAHVGTDTVGVSLSAPILHPNGSLHGVVAVDYLFSAMQSEFFSAQSALQTTGVLLLINSEGTIMASSSESSKLLSQVDIQCILQMPVPADVHSQDPVIHEASVGPFGQSIVLLLSFAEATFSKAKGLDWRLVIILPKSDYYRILDEDKPMQIGLIVGAILCFTLAMALLIHLTVRRPLRKLRDNLVSMKDLVVRMVPLENAIRPSRFSEIAAVYDGVMIILHAAEESAQLRFAEVSAAAELRRSQAESERLMRSKDLFFAMMSHEMRTPLTACIGMAEVLLGTELTDQQKECVDAIGLSGTALLYLINDILDFSKIESGKLDIERRAFSVRECIEQSSQVIQIKADEKNIELIVMIDSNLPEKCIGDSCRIRQVLFNLLSNAVKFTHRGFVSLSCIVSVDDCRLVRFCVEDSGIGIAPEKLGQLFKPFTQADSSTTRRYGGTGLGLVITKRLVEMMGGEMQVNSEGDGKGCSFSFALPLISGVVEGGLPFARTGSLKMPNSVNNNTDAAPTPPPFVPIASTTSYIARSPMMRTSRASPQPSFKHDLSALIIDKMERRRDAIRELFVALSIPVYTCDNVGFLIENKLVEPAASASLVVMDFQDFQQGKAAIASPSRFTSSISPRPTPSDLSLSANSSCFTNASPRSTSTTSTSVFRKFILVVSMKQGVSAPPDDHSLFISKPVTTGKLSQAIRLLFPPSYAEREGCFPVPSYIGEASGEAFGRRASSLPAAIPREDSVATFCTTNARILIVDDVVLNQRVITLKLLQRGYQHLFVASSGVEALQIVAEHSQPFDVILMDCMMPETAMFSEDTCEILSRFLQGKGSTGGL